MESVLLHRSESLILTAIDVINELGIQGLSIREVAKRQDISNAAIFSHFKSKNELIFAVLDHFTQYDDVIEQAIHIKGLHSKSAIIYYVDSYYTYYENYPAITAIALSLDGLRCEKVFSEKVKRIIYTRNAFVKQLVEEAQKAGDIRQDIDSECIADMIQGSCRLVCMKWRIEEYAFPLKERILYTVHSILDTLSIH